MFKQNQYFFNFPKSIHTWQLYLPNRQFRCMTGCMPMTSTIRRRKYYYNLNESYKTSSGVWFLDPNHMVSLFPPQFVDVTFEMFIFCSPFCFFLIQLKRSPAGHGHDRLTYLSRCKARLRIFLQKYSECAKTIREKNIT